MRLPLSLLAAALFFIMPHLALADGGLLERDDRNFPSMGATSDKDPTKVINLRASEDTGELFMMEGIGLLMDEVIGDELRIEVVLENIAALTETVILAADVNKRYLVTMIEITVDVGVSNEAHGSVHFDATVSSTNKLVNFDSAHLGGLLLVKSQKADDFNIPVFVIVDKVLGVGEKVRVLIHYKEITLAP